MNWFAATDTANIPAPSGSSQSLTIAAGVTGLTAANFIVKAYSTGGAPATDSVPPAVSLTAPAGGSNVSGTVTVSATATDNIAVAGVQFQLDGSSLGSMVAGSGPSFHHFLEYDYSLRRHPHPHRDCIGCRREMTPPARQFQFRYPGPLPR